MMTKHQKCWIIKHYASGDLKGTELELIERPIPSLTKGQVLIKTIILSLDPSNRIWLSETEDYLPQLALGDVMRGLVIGQIVESRHPHFKIGDYLHTLQGWQEYAVVDGDSLTPEKGTIRFTPHPDIPLDAYASALGLTGWTAFIGLREIAQLRAHNNLLVSGAAGATGLLACQLGKAMHAKVVGIAGGAQKCHLLETQFQLDGSIDYKATDNLSEAMAQQFPNGIDVFFDNVGGPMLDAALENMAIGGTIVASGSISQYQKLGDKTQLYGVQNTPLLITKRLKMQGYLILDHLNQIDHILPSLERWLLEGKIQYRNTEVIGLENAQQTLPQLFSGRNTGKLVVSVS
ncbi:NADP-dependent oxidoreductase [Amphritea sp. 2_MG-2023]|uniref:NADP-dependent oxidoreductase n=1 Tax=Amphritea TaxID=515417 RepID=UPI001C074AE4|nr:MULTISPECIES: NADP-dependent oxidoreductase [Amphritea]MBU2964644.1 NADP-dependent oxidoreductase [Amphritea atlantica]MDO6420414.1 NADP-dependent oxidoreductase [Amphritea sp. 2_MG-2023]